MKKRPQTTRERAAWRFDPRFLKRLRDFTAKRPLQTTQTQVIEAGTTDYMNRVEDQESRETPRR